MDLGAQTAYLASRLTIFMVMLAGLLLALYVGVSVSDRDMMPVMLMIMAIVSTAWVLISGANYWILIPMAFSLTIPALPVGPRAFELSELSVMGCFAIFCARLAFKVQRLDLLRFDYLFVAAYVTWVAVIYMRNPAGFLFLGSSSAGARFYFQIGLAFLAFLVMSNQRLEEKQCKWIVWLILAGSIGTGSYIAWGIVRGGGLAGNFAQEEEDTWQQAFIAPLSFWLSFLLGHYRFQQLFSIPRFYLMPFFLFLYYAAMMTGKRAVLATMLAMPLIIALLRRQWCFLVAGAAFGGLFLTFLVVGHGQWFELPFRAQRAIMYLPGRWDPQLKGVSGEQGQLDSFRARMNAKAIERIKESPWVGQGFQIHVEDFQRMNVVTYGGGVDVDVQIEMLAAGSAWHNQWLGMSADFGIPAAIIHACYYLQMIVLLLWLWSRIPFGTYRHTLLVMIGLFMASQMLTSYTGGHSTGTPYNQWWMFGILIALRQTLRQEAAEAAKGTGEMPSVRKPDTQKLKRETLKVRA